MKSVRSLPGARLFAVALLSCLSAALNSCGPSQSEDVFYMYNHNGYAGGGALSIYGATGPLVTGCELGDCTPEGPLVIDRERFDGQLQVSVEGSPGLSTVQLDSFAFYPQETVTLFMTRRASAGSFEFRVLRHHQIAAGGPVPDVIPPSVSTYPCVVQLFNGLSLTNTYTDARFDIQTQWNLNEAYDLGSTGLQLYPLPTTSAINQAERRIPTECGELDLDTLTTSQQNNLGLQVRQGQIEDIASDPWFFPVQDTEGNGTLTFRWGRWDAVSGDTINGVRTSREYRECIAQAITFEPPEGMATMGDVCDQNDQGELIPPQDKSFIRVDPNVALDCVTSTSYTGLALQPNDQEGQIIYYYDLPNADGCTVDMRFVTRAVNSVFRPPQRQGQLISTTIGGSQVNFPNYTWLHVILYGRPINPLLFQRSSADFSEDFTQIGYPNGQVPDYGVIDTRTGGQTGGGGGGGQP